jgi:hypothetical protein
LPINIRPSIHPLEVPGVESVCKIVVHMLNELRRWVLSVAVCGWWWVIVRSGVGSGGLWLVSKCVLNSCSVPKKRGFVGHVG